MANATTLAASALEDVAAAAKHRGFRPWIAAALIVVGCIPTILLTITRGAGYETAPFIGLFFWLGPTALLSAWILSDREGSAAREIWMWFLAVDRGVRQQGSETGAVALFESATEGWSDRSWTDIAESLRTALTPRVRSPRSQAARIFLYRNWYSVVWTAIAAIAAVLYTTLIAVTG
jgi:hypothetical protein